MFDSYNKYIVAYIDILGFKELVSKSEINQKDFIKIHKALNKFTLLKNKEFWEEARILMSVEEDVQKKIETDFYIDHMVHCSCFSDGVIIAVEAGEKINERCSALIALLAKISNELLREKIAIRGAISYGNLFINDSSDIYFGNALIEAYTLESTISKYPRIILSANLIKELNYPLLNKADRMPYHQYIERFSDGTAGFSPLIYLQVMENAPDVLSEEELEKALNESLTAITMGLDENIECPYRYEKYSWLMERYNKLIIFNTSKNKIYTPDDVDSRHNIHFETVTRIKAKLNGVTQPY